jgi:5-methylcytosine-specific restriction enzyme A
MALADLTRDSVIRAVEEFDSLGREAFLRKYGFGKARDYWLVLDGKNYDSKAIAGAAHQFIAGGSEPLSPDQFSGGEQTVARVLRRLGFDLRETGTEPQHRNEPWSRDELILALDLYMTNPASPPGKSSKEVQDLSSLLNRLAQQLNRGGTHATTYRNANGVYMKMMNFRRFDPAFTATGKVGLTRGNKDEAIVWDEFSADRQKLRQVSAAIRAAILLPPDQQPPPYDEDEIAEAEEGQILTRFHRVRERNRTLVEKRKKQAQKDGSFRCEVCEFDFEKQYGERGKGFIEVHHTKPVHALVAGSKTRLEDLALVCANCHRMIHSRRPWLSISELRSLIDAA